jgi:glycosyltransferase involved in cell wall biosynthesis
MVKQIGILGTVSPWMSGGAAVHPAELMKALSERYSFRAVTPTDAAHATSPDNSAVRTVRAVPYVVSFLVLAQAIRFLRDVDLLHCHDPRLFPIKQFVRKPLVTTFHGYLTREAEADYHTHPGLPRFEFYRRTLHGCVRASDCLIAVDQRIASWLTEEFSANDVQVIPNGVDTDRFRPLRPSRDVVRRFGINDKGPLILAAKHFTPKNGLEYIVRAMPLVLEEIPDAHLVLAGDGKLREKLVSIVSDLRIGDSVSMPGQIANEYMPEIIAACDIGTIPSVPVSGVEEATSVLMLEMMACGKLVVASAIGGLRETIRNGETGILCEPANPQALADSVVSGLSNLELRTRIGLNARKFVELHHSWRAMGERIGRLYERFLEA